MLRTVLAPTQVITQSGGVPSGGLQGQVLSKASATDGDVAWVSVNTGVIDTELSSSSTNAISNQAVTSALSWKSITE